jgi:hypothetical protein
VVWWGQTNSILGGGAKGRGCAPKFWIWRLVSSGIDLFYPTTHKNCSKHVTGNHEYSIYNNLRQQRILGHSNLHFPSTYVICEETMRVWWSSTRKHLDCLCSMTAFLASGASTRKTNRWEDCFEVIFLRLIWWLHIWVLRTAQMGLELHILCRTAR